MLFFLLDSILQFQPIATVRLFSQLSVELCLVTTAHCPAICQLCVVPHISLSLTLVRISYQLENEMPMNILFQNYCMQQLSCSRSHSPLSCSLILSRSQSAIGQQTNFLLMFGTLKICFGLSLKVNDAHTYHYYICIYIYICISTKYMYVYLLTGTK